MSGGGGWLWGTKDYYKENKKTRKGKQGKIPKKPRFEPKSTIIPGKHPVIFKKAVEMKKWGM